MATITGSVSTNSTRYSYYLVWSESEINSVANTSKVTCSVYVKKISSYSTEGSGNSNTLYIDGTAFTTSGLYIDMNPETTPRLVASGSKTITHNADGSKSISVSCSGSLPTVYGPTSGSVSGTITLTTIVVGSTQSDQGEGTGGAGSYVSTSNGSGSGGAYVSGATSKSGSGGSHATAGGEGTGGGDPGDIVGSADLTTMVFGAGGSGAAMNTTTTSTCANAASGGGIVFVAGVDVVVTGSITADGGDGANGTDDLDGGAGAGGSVLIKAQTATLGAGLITATGGTAGGVGGAGGDGRIHIDYLTSYTGTTSPTITASQDATLTANTEYKLNLFTSDDGTNIDTYTKALLALSTNTWKHLAVSVDISASTTTFYEDGTSIGTATGTLTSIYNSTALLGVGADFDGASAARSFLDGLIDDIRLWSDIRTASEISANRQVQLAGTESNLVGYWSLNNDDDDVTANNNDLTLAAAPIYSTSVPFAAATTRRDIDQSDSSSGQTYAVPTTISEAAVGRQSFVPAKDPQKSIAVNISAIGTTADWTLTVHDTLNREVASKTITNASLNTGTYEFIFDDVWTPIIGVTYHFHLTVTNTTGTPAVVSGTANDLETAQFTSYYQFLVTDSDFHPIASCLNFIVVGNGRYVAKWDGATYDPHRLTFPSGWKVRVIAPFREYTAFGCWKGSAINDYDEGIIFLWDGISETYNYYINVPEGGINAMFGAQGILNIIAGYGGDLLQYRGGDSAETVKTITRNGEQLEVYPGAVSMWKTLLRIGVGSTESDTLEQGVYTYGSQNNNYPDSLSFDYRISTGNSQGNTIKVGMVLPVGGSLLVGWKDNVSYGIDSIPESSTVFGDGSIDFMIRDEGGVWKEKKIDLIRADFEPLVTGQTIGIQYKIDRSDAWTTEVTENTVGKKKLRVQAPKTRHVEYQVKLNMRTTTTSPAVHGLTVVEDLKAEEENV